MANVARKWALCLGLVGIFLAGAITGVVGAAGYAHHRLRALHAEGPQALHRLGMTLLDWKLGLSDQQEVEIDAILRDTHHEFLQFKSRHNEEIRQIVLPALERIDAVLTPKQAEAWRDLREGIARHVEDAADVHAGG